MPGPVGCPIGLSMPCAPPTPFNGCLHGFPHCGQTSFGAAWLANIVDDMDLVGNTTAIIITDIRVGALNFPVRLLEPLRDSQVCHMVQVDKDNRSQCSPG